MAFGIPNAADLNGIVNNLGAIVASIGPEGSAVISGAISQLSDHANALEDKAIAAEVAAEDKLLVRIDTLNATLNRFVDLLQSLKDDGIPVSGMLFGGKKA